MVVKPWGIITLPTIHHLELNFAECSIWNHHTKKDT